MTLESRHPSLVAVSVILLIFVAGVVFGIAGARIYGSRSGPGTKVVSDMSATLDQLNLSTAQRTQVENILDRSAPRSRDAMLEIASRLRSISDSVDTEIRLILTPAQRAKLDSLRKPPTFILRTKDSAGAIRVDTVIPARIR